MAPSSAIRSFAITFAIAITIIGPKANGFSISRTTTLPSTSRDLSSDESSQLQIKSYESKSNAIKNSNNEDTNKSTPIGSNNETTTETSGYTSTERTATTLQGTVKVKSTTENTKIPTISSDTVEVFDSAELVSEANIVDLKQTVISLGKTHTTTNTEIFREVESTTELTAFTDQIATESATNEYQSTKIGIPSPISGSDEATTALFVMTATTGTIESMEMPTKDTDLPIAKDIGSTSTDFTTDLPQIVSDRLLLTTISSEHSKITMEVSSEKLTETTDAPKTKITEPLWKKYTTIIRKRVTSSEDQTAKTEDDTMIAETSNTQLNFDKIFDVTPAPNLENLRVDLLQNTNHSTNSAMMIEETQKTTVAGKTMLSTFDSTEAKKTETVQTKRAGYLDNSQKVTTPTDVLYKSIGKENDTEPIGPVENSKSTEVAGPDFKKVSGFESQSQLAEDALQEELLKEEALKNDLNVNRYRDENSEKKESPGEPSLLGVTSPLSTNEDPLSVQPINFERSKTTMYTINPNYKPMKKLDIQPSKPFIRDPDDNSWRNESISSLGIVFKPKNSSKSFKEVLKNKTQTEFNNIQEKDTKDDLPDLRVRLEKIAEVRKTKKKKMNKDGEEVYVDYEESNSAERPKTESNSPALSSLNVAKLITPFDFHSEQELTTPLTGTWEELKAKNAKMGTPTLSKGPRTDSLTTQTPKKIFNIAEYYDTTDEYDADYVTMSKLDLKKYTPLFPPRTTETPTTIPVQPLTRHMEPHFPERKPTVQYFPPRLPPQKVNVNNFDADFERKIKLYTYKAPPKVEPLPPFVTVPPVHIARDKPDNVMRPGVRPDIRPTERPDIRPTVRPADLSMYMPIGMTKAYYLTNAPRTPEALRGFVINDETLDRGSYVIKHYKDFLHAAGKDNDDDRGSDRDFLAIHTPTEPPRVTSSLDEMEKTTRGKDDEYDYEGQFHREVLNRFVDNFNQNSERFKVNFPILYNNSIVHRKVDDNGRGVASSRVFLKRLYNDGTATKANALLKKPCEPNCDMTVELSPAYELHYYVPEQEERQEPEPPARYAL